MTADDLVHESGFACARASDIETASLNSGGHDTKADSDLWTQSELYPVNIEAVAQIARLYAARTPPDEEFRLIKEGINTYGNADKQKGVHFTPREWRTAQEMWSRGVTYEPHTADNAFNQPTKIIREKSDFSAELRALESSIRVVPSPSGFKVRFVSARALMRGRISRVAFPFAAVIGLIFCWHSHEAKEIVSHWALSVDRLLSVSTRKSPPSLATSSDLRRGAVAPKVTAARHSANQFDAQQERKYADGAATHGVKQHTESKTSSPPLRSQVKRIPVPETGLTTIEGWMLREVNSGKAVLEGPNGIWTAKRGDTVPGVGRVESIVLWGARWIVATSSGLLSTPYRGYVTPSGRPYSASAIASMLRVK
jgi:hypothetical protein